MKIDCKNEKELVALGKKFSRTLCGGDVVLLRGELGAGKTTFARGIAAGLSIRKRITSPTFTIINVYKLPRVVRHARLLVHADTYRLDDPQEIFTLGLDEYIYNPEAITLIEWPEKIEKRLRAHRVKSVTIKFVSIGRRVTLS